MGKEIERKFLLRKGSSVPTPKNFVKLNIKQGYIHAEKGKQVRVRITNNLLGNVCIKFTNTIVRDEFEYQIPLKDAKVMYEMAPLKVEKKRISFNRKVNYDIDTYPNGLVVVEVEFKTLDQMNKWVKPDWLGIEITGNNRYSNITLAKKNLKW